MNKLLLVAIGVIPMLSANAELLPAQVTGLTKVVKEFPATAASVQKMTRKPVVQEIVSPDGNYDFYPCYSMPATPFYMGGLNHPQNGRIAPVAYPAHVPQTFEGLTYVGRTSQSSPVFDQFDKFSYSWDYWNFVTGEKLTPTSKTLTTEFTYNTALDLYNPPTMTMHFPDMEETPDSPYVIVMGGDGRVPLLNEEGQLDAVNIGFSTTAWIEGLNYATPRAMETNFGSLKYSGEDFTFTDYVEEIAMGNWADAFEDAFEEPLQEINVKGIGFDMPYAGAPYLLKSMSFNSYTSLTKEITFKFDFYKVDEEGNQTNEIIYSAEVKCAPNSNADTAYTPMNINFISTDSEGWELDYILIDSPLFVTVTGWENDMDVEWFCPWTFGYSEDASGFSIDVPVTACSLLELIGSAGTTRTVKNYLSGAWGTPSTGYFSYHSFDIDIEAEYPYLEPTALFINDGDGEAINYKEDGNYNISIPDNASEVVVVIATSALSADEIMIDDEDLPEWISEISIGDATNLVSGQDVFNAIELQIILDGDFKNKSAVIPMTYKTLNIQVALTNGESGVSNIVVDGNDTPVYYDLQGRKLNNTPDKGIYLLKEGTKVSKVIR